MQDLFTTTSPNTTKGENKNITPTPAGTPLKNGKSKSLFRVYYKGKGGKFSDKDSARIVQIEKDNRIFKNNWYYWKRQAERLSADYFTEHEKVLELEEKVKVLQEKLNSLTNNSYAENTNLQQQKVFAS